MKNHDPVTTQKHTKLTYFTARSHRKYFSPSNCATSN